MIEFAIIYVFNYYYEHFNIILLYLGFLPYLLVMSHIGKTILLICWIFFRYIRYIILPCRFSWLLYHVISCTHWALKIKIFWWSIYCFSVHTYCNRKPNWQFFYGAHVDLKMYILLWKIVWTIDNEIASIWVHVLYFLLHYHTIWFIRMKLQC